MTSRKKEQVTETMAIYKATPLRKTLFENVAIVKDLTILVIPSEIAKIYEILFKNRRYKETLYSFRKKPDHAESVERLDVVGKARLELIKKYIQAFLDKDEIAKQKILFEVEYTKEG